MKLFIFLPRVDLDSTKKDVIVLPPDLKRSVSRTIKNKHREEEEEEEEEDLSGNVRKMIVTLRWNICKQNEHNSRTCHRDIAEQIVGFRVSSGGKKGLIAFTRGKNIFRRWIRGSRGEKSGMDESSGADTSPLNTQHKHMWFI